MPEHGDPIPGTVLVLFKQGTSFEEARRVIVELSSGEISIIEFIPALWCARATVPIGEEALWVSRLCNHEKVNVVEREWYFKGHREDHRGT